jgi:hypothetical protein
MVIVAIANLIAWRAEHVNRKRREGEIARLRGLIRGAFYEGRESTTGTDRHRADDAWGNSRAKRYVEAPQ